MRNYSLYAIRYPLILIFVFSLTGCDAFVRKFTRKTKRENLAKEEMVLAPEEYKSTMTKEELYRQYLLFWKSWQDELIEALSHSDNHKKQVSCANEALKNLDQLRQLLNIEKQEKLDIDIEQLKTLRDLIVKDVYGLNILTHRLRAESIKRNILRDFSYSKISKDISYMSELITPSCFRP